MNILKGENMKKGFTLAEVLITIGIVGVVSAMTIPSLINYYKAKELEVRFKKADAILSQALLKTANEYGYDSISSFNIPGRKVTDENLAELKEQVVELNKIWLKQFTNAEPLRFQDKSNYYYQKACHHLTGEIFGMYRTCWFSFGQPYQLPDGLLVSELRAQNGGGNHPGLIMFFFDTNGPAQGPNRWGHDLFLYYSDIDYATYCNPTLKISSNNFGCYHYAHKNINPAGKNKPYWDILFKPLSYWQNANK